jgi:acyl carrier protein
VLAQIRAIARAELETEREVAPEDDLVQVLALDSLTRLTLLVAVEDHFRVALPDEALERVHTLADFCRLVVRVETEPRS